MRRGQSPPESVVVSSTHTELTTHRQVGGLTPGRQGLVSVGIVSRRLMVSHQVAPGRGGGILLAIGSDHTHWQSRELAVIHTGYFHYHQVGFMGTYYLVGISSPY